VAKGKKEAKKKPEGKRKKKPSVRLPVAPPSWAHRPKSEYRRQREKDHLRRESVEEESPEGGTDEDEADAGEDDASA
jgi:hypothetical protein